MQITTYAYFAIFAALQGPARDSLLAEGIRLSGMEPGAALVRFEKILARDSADTEANWRAAIALADLSEPLARSSRKDSLLEQAERYARRGVRLAPNRARTLFTLGLVLGTRALTRGLKERVRSAVEIHELARKAIAEDSTLDGAHHLLGRWNYEVMRLSGFERFVARHLLGGGSLSQASWDEAQREMERAVELDQTRIHHRLDLARVLLARRQEPAADSLLRSIGRLPDRVVADSMYRRQARELLERER